MPIDRTNLTDRSVDDFATVNDINIVYRAVNNLKNNATDTTDGKFTGSDLEIDTDASVAGDRGAKFWLTASTWVRFWWNQADTVFQFSDQVGGLQKIAFANGTAATHGVTKSQLDTAINALQLEVTGAVKLYAGLTPPTGYLLCNGQAVSRTTYSALFAITSTSFGSGNGTTTFNLPDLRGRVPLGLDNMGGMAASRLTSQSFGGSDAGTLGGAGGEEAHVLTLSEIPAHTHTVAVSALPNNAPASPGTGAAQVSTASTASSSVGSGNTHSNTQPWLALSYIIKI